MATKYSREDWREHAKGAQRFATQGTPPGYSRSINPKRANLFVLLITGGAIVMLMVQRPDPDRAGEQSNIEERDGHAVVVGKEIRAQGGEEREFVMRIELRVPTGPNQVHEVTVTPEEWLEYADGDPLEVAYDLDEDSGDIRILYFRKSEGN